jgi:hypothetical protein
VAGYARAEWLQARDADEQTFTLRQRAIPGSVEVLINRLDELADIFSVHEKDVTVSTKLSKTDVVTIKYGGVGGPHLRGNYNAVILGRRLKPRRGVRHFSRFSRSGLPDCRYRSTLSGGWRPDLHPKHIPVVDPHGTGLAQEVGAETAPAPELRGGHQAALHRISMHVAKFFDAFVFGPHVEIVEPFLPDVLREVVEQNSLRWIASTTRLRQNASRKSEFKSLHHGGRGFDLRFADQQ